MHTGVILDTGNRREFESGAVRDINEGKGRCDLMPLDALPVLMPSQNLANTMHYVSQYTYTGDTENLHKAICAFCAETDMSMPALLLEVSIHYEQGCVKYGERNWEKGIPLHCYIDSGVRHLLKYCDGRTDERHDRAFVWNMLGAIWTHHHLPNMIDIHFQNKLLSEAAVSEGTDDTSK